MTGWIVGNAWWVAPALTFAGVGMFVGALLWPRKVRPDTVEDVHWKDKELWDLKQERETLLQAAVDRRGRHLRTD